MFKRLLEWMVPLLIVSRSQKAFAFDPVTVAMTAQTAQSVMGQVDEAADVGFSLIDLLSELGVETDSEEELEHAVDRIGQINSQARDLKWASEDLHRSLNDDLSKGNSLNRRLRALRSTVRTSKQIAALMGFRPKAAEKAVKIQEIKLNSMMLEELQSIRRAQYLSYLENREAKLKRDVFLQEIVEQRNEKGVRSSTSRNLARGGT